MPTAPRRILIVQNGTTDPPVVARFGDYDDWFTERFAVLGFETHVIEAFRGETLPDTSTLAHTYQGVVLSGSPFSVADRAPWVLAMGQFGIDAAAHLPVLAVCFGHQAVGEVLGGQVRPSPNGKEYGTITLSLTEAGAVHPVLGAMGPAPRFQSVHGDALLVAPPGATVLAGTPHTEIQAFSWGPRLTAVQFHPELAPDTLRALCENRRVIATVTDGDQGPDLLAAWVGTFCPPETRIHRG